MRKITNQLILILYFALLPQVASAMQLGKLSIYSALGEPLNVENDLLALKKGGADLTEEVFNRIGSQIRASVASFIKQSGAAGIEKINLVSSCRILN